MKKILFLIHDLSHGGAEKVLVNLVNHMDRTKFDITVIALFGGGVNEQFLKSDIRFRSIFHRAIPGNSKLMKLLTPQQLHQWFIKDEYDIEVSYLEGPSARIISGCPNKETKLVSWIHVEQHTKGIAAQAFRSYDESVRCYSRFHKTVCVSQSVKEDFAALYPMLPESVVLYNTNETDRILELQNDPVEEGSFSEKELRICGVGKIMPVKGFDKLARIHCRLRKEGYLVHTYVLGVGPEQPKIQQYIDSQKCCDSFTFLGYQTNPYKYVARCDLFVCASAAEGFSTAATEALVLGVPVVTTPVAGMREMLGDNEYGLITENNEAALYQGIKKLLDRPELLKHYREQAKIRGTFFSTEKTVRAVEDMFLEQTENENTQ